MRLPFPDHLLVTPCKIVTELDGLSEDGHVVDGETWEGKVVFTVTRKKVLNTNNQIISLNGRMLLKGVILPSNVVSGGRVTIYPDTPSSREFRVHSVAENRNPDGTIHSTYLELI